MNIGIDLDEVLADFLTSLIEFHNRKYGTNFSRKQFHSYRVYEIWGGTLDDALNDIYEFYETECFENIRPVQGAQKNIEFLSKSHKLTIITSRQNDVSRKTIEWINRYFEGKFSGVFFTNDNSRHRPRFNKSDVCKKCGIEFMVEDHLDYATECAKSVKKVMLLDSPWNKSNDLPENVLRVYSWKEISEMITSPK